MSNDFIGAGANILISRGETKGHAKKRIFDDDYELLNELEKVTSNLIEMTYCFFSGDTTASEKNILRMFNTVGKEYKNFRALTQQNRSHISKDLYEILMEIEAELLREMRSPKELFFIKTEEIEVLQEKFIKQLKTCRKQLVKGVYNK